MPGYALGRKVEERTVLSTTRSQSTHAFSIFAPPLFQVRELRRQKETTQRPVLGSEGHLWNSRLRGDSLGDRFISKLHEHPDCCWCCVELGHLVFVHNAPQAALIWICGDPLKLPPVKSGYFCLPNSPSTPLSFSQVQYLPFLTNYVFTL